MFSKPRFFDLSRNKDFAKINILIQQKGLLCCKTDEATPIMVKGNIFFIKTYL